MPLPAFTTSRRVRFGALMALYVGQGLPQGLLVVALPAYLAEQGASAEAVGGVVAAALLPFTLKVVAGPVMDRYAFPPMGRRRPWILGAGLCLLAALAALAQIDDPVANLGAVMAAAAAVNTFVSLVDVAVDGLAVEVLELDEQPRANALMWGSAVLGVAASAVGLGRALSAGGLGVAAPALAAAMACVLAVPLLLRERPGERLLPWTAGEATDAAPAPAWGGLLRTLRAEVLLPASLALLAVAFLSGAVDGLVIGYLPVLTVQGLGWEDTAYSDLVAAGQVTAGVVGMALGALLIGRVGRVRMMRATLAAVALVLAAMGLAEPVWAVTATVAAFGFGYLGAFVLFSITFLSTAMALVGRTAAATHFALFTAASNVGRSSGSALVGPADTALSAPAVFFATAALAASLLLLVRLVDVEAHRRRLADAAR